MIDLEKSPLGLSTVSDSGKSHQWMLKHRSLMKTRHYSLKVSPQKILTNYCNRLINYAVKESDRHHRNPTIKMNTTSIITFFLINTKKNTAKLWWFHCPKMHKS